MVEDKLNWQRWGVYYGYPKCCIDFFLKYSDKPYWFHKQYPKGFKLCGTGYIPCKSCNKLSEQEIIKRINYRRKCLTPFPEDGNFEHEELHRELLIKTGEIK